LQTENIFEELDKLHTWIKEAGYVPDTSSVLHDVGEQQKEQARCYHSEKLAIISYGLISTLPGAPICIIKSMQVCGDGHTATELISKIWK
jgi:hypothetical protein